MLGWRNPGLKWLLCFCLIFQFSGCAVNLHRWSEEPPEREKLSLKERKEAVLRYQFKEINSWSWDNFVIGSDQPKSYFHESFYPFMLKISPNSQKYISDLDNSRIAIFSLGAAEFVLFFLAYEVSHVNNLNDNSEQRFAIFSGINTGTAIGVSILTLIAGVLCYQQWDAANHLKETYNADLKRYYLPEGGSLDSLIPAPHLSVAPSTP